MVTLLPVQQQEGTADSSGLQLHMVWQCMGENPRNIDYNVKVIVLGSVVNVVALTLITGSAPLVLCIDVI